MELRVEESGPLSRTLRVEIPTADVDAAFDVVYEQLGRRAHLKGFRPGKAPRSVLERYFADEARGDVLERLVRDTLPKAVDEAALKLVTMPRVAPPEEAPRQGTPFSYEAHVELQPVIELKQVRGLPVPDVQLEEPEGDPVQNYLERSRSERAILHPVEAGTAAAAGHLAAFELHAQRADEPEPWLDGQERELVLGENGFLPGFDAQVLGMCEGDSREFEVELPTPARAKDAAGEGEEPAQADGAPARATVRALLRSLRRRELPELDDEFAMDLSDFSTLEELRADLRVRYERGRDAERLRRREQLALDALIAANDSPVPQTLVEEQVERRLRSQFGNLRGFDHEDPQVRELLQQFAAQLRPLAEREVRAAFLFHQIAQAEKIEVSDEDVAARARELAAERAEAGKPRAKEGEGLRDALREQLLERRVFAFLLEHAQPAPTHA
jgi:trigger factor